MNAIAAPVTQLLTANTQVLSRFLQSQEMLDLASTNLRKSIEMAQSSVGTIASSKAFEQLVQAMTTNYSNFILEFSQGLMSSAADGQAKWAQQMTEASAKIIAMR